MDEVSIEILVETPGANNSGAPYDVCLNSNVASKGSIGNALAAKFALNACKCFTHADSTRCSLTSNNSQRHYRPPPIAGFWHKLHSDRRRRHASALFLRDRRPRLLRLLRAFQRSNPSHSPFSHNSPLTTSPARLPQLRILLRPNLLLQQRPGLARLRRPRKRLSRRIPRALHGQIPFAEFSAQRDIRQQLDVLPAAAEHLRRRDARGSRAGRADGVQPHGAVRRAAVECGRQLAFEQFCGEQAGAVRDAFHYASAGV